MEKFQFAGEGHEYLDGSLKPRRDGMLLVPLMKEFISVSYESEDF